MDTSELIRDEARKISSKIQSFSKKDDGIQRYKTLLNDRLYDYYENSDKLIFLYELINVTSRLLEQHLKICTYKTENQSCPINVYYYKAKFFIEQEIKDLNPSYNYTILRPNINSDILRENLIQLTGFPEASQLYQSALDKLNEGRYERNILDDLRLSLELILKSILKNNKSLENQIENIGNHLKTLNYSKESTNMFRTLLDYYSKYQNNYIKHNDEVRKDEVELIINLSSAFIRFIIKIK